MVLLKQKGLEPCLIAITIPAQTVVRFRRAKAFKDAIEVRPWPVRFAV